jgi:hypothetical protein
MNRRSPTRRPPPKSPPQPASLSLESAERRDDRWLPGWREKLKSNRLLVAGLMTAGLVLGVLAIFTPRFETNDDAGMNAIAAGRMFVDHPDEHLVFSNVLIGLALKGLYRAAPNIPWYGGSLFLTASLSLAAIAFACLRRPVSTFDVCLTAALLCLVGAPFLIVLQFTRVAFLASLAGLLLLAAIVRDGKPALHSLWAIPFLTAGALIRFESLLLAAVVLSALVGWILWRARSQPAARAAVVILAAAVAVGFAFFRFNTWYYSRDEAWRDFYKFNALRVEFTDYGRGEYNESTAPVFSKVGWTRADVDMLRAWCFLDRDRFNVQTLQTVLDGLASRERATETRSWQELAEIVLADTEVLALWACGAIFLLALRSDASARFVRLGCYLATVALCIYLYRDLHLPARVYCPAFAACALVSLVLSAGPRSIGKGAPWTRSIVARGTMAVLLGALLLWRGAVTLKENADFLVARAQAEDLLRRLKPRRDQLFVVWGSDFPYEHVVLPLDSHDPASNFKVLGLDSLAVTPFTTARQQEFGISDLYSILRRRRGIYVISTKPENGLLARYFRDRYRLRIGGAIVFSHPALGLAAVYSLAITGIAPPAAPQPPAVERGPGPN